MPQLPGDQQALDLAGALIDLGNACVAVESFHRIIVQVAVATVDLDGLLAHLFGHFAGEQFGLGGL